MSKKIFSGGGVALSVCNAIKKPVLFVTFGNEKKHDKIKFFDQIDFMKETDVGQVLQEIADKLIKKMGG